MGAHTSALPVLISSHAGEQWHQAGGLLEKQGMYPKYPPPPCTNPSTHTQRSVWTYVSIWACGRAHEEKVCLGRTVSVYRLFFCVDDAKINCDLETWTAAGEEASPLYVGDGSTLFCFRVVFIVIKQEGRERERVKQSNKKYIVFILFSLTDEMALAVISLLLPLLWGEVKYYLGGKWVESGHYSCYSILLLVMPSLQSCTSAISPWQKDSNHRMKGRQVLSTATSKALNTNIYHLPTIKHNLTSSIPASPLSTYLGNFRDHF